MRAAQPLRRGRGRGRTQSLDLRSHDVHDGVAAQVECVANELRPRVAVLLPRERPDEIVDQLAVRNCGDHASGDHPHLRIGVAQRLSEIRIHAVVVA